MTTINHSDKMYRHACGENQRGWPYENTRMDNVWALREIYDKAWQIKQKQDEYCEKALANDWEGLGAFPDELKWEALVDVLRGRVKVKNDDKLDSESMMLTLAIGPSTLLRGRGLGWHCQSTPLLLTNRARMLTFSTNPSSPMSSSFLSLHSTMLTRLTSCLIY